MRKIGPLIFKGDYENLDEDLSALGPIVANGDLIVRSTKSMGPTTVKGKLAAEFISVNGPLVVKDELIANHIKVNGPIKVKGDCLITEGRINGPLLVTKAVKVVEHLRINGVLKAEKAIGKVLEINGVVDVEGELAATERISIGLTGNDASKTLRAEVIKAPIVEIRHRQSFFPRILQLLLGKGGQQMELLDVRTPIEADHVILDGIKYNGLLKSENVTLLNGAEYYELLDE